MPYSDLAPDVLRAYQPDLVIPDDLDTFWATTLSTANDHDLAATFNPVSSGLRTIETFDVSFAGFGGSPVRAWLHFPAGTTDVLPAIVEYVGYGGGRGLAHERVLWAGAGYAHLVVDNRGQGSNSSIGETADRDPDGGPASPGFMTRGILDPHAYYYRRLFTDAARAVQAVRAHPRVDCARVAVTGTSQGGGTSLAIASLIDDIAAVAADVPFLADFPRAISIVELDPYAEIARYLRTHRDHVERVLATLAYFDVASLVRHAKAPALFSVGMMDPTCPPSTVYAAFNHYQGPKRMVEYPFNGHEGGEGFHQIVKMQFFDEHLRP